MKSFQHTIIEKGIITLLTIIIFVSLISIMKQNSFILFFHSKNYCLSKVLKYYKNDIEKYNAASFLIKNMTNKYTYKVTIKDSLKTNTRFSLFDKHINNKNYKFILDSLNLHLETDLLYDTQHLDSKYLIENCNNAFYAWKNFPWSNGYTKKIFYEYILPYRINKENLTDWRSFFMKRYTSLIDTMKNEKTVQNIAQLIIKDINNQISYSNNSLNIKPSLDYKEAFLSSKGNCSIIADIIVLALRSMGIASTKDYIPLWGNADNGHIEVVYFDEDCNPRMLQTGNWLAAHPPKIFRQVYSNTETNNIKKFDDNCYLDVTNEYIATSNIKITTKSIQKDIYLAVYNNNKWKEIAKGEIINDKSYIFYNMGRSIMYLPIAKKDYKGMNAISDPLSIDFLGNIKKYKINNNSTVHINLTQYLASLHITNNIDYYELAYWNISHWSTQCISGDQHKGFYAHNVPSNTLYTIIDKRDLKFKGRIFTYENNIIKW